MAVEHFCAADVAHELRCLVRIHQRGQMVAGVGMTEGIIGPAFDSSGAYELREPLGKRLR